MQERNKDKFVSRRDENIVHVDFPAANKARKPQPPPLNPFHALDIGVDSPLFRRIDLAAPWVIKLSAGILILILSLLIL